MSTNENDPAKVMAEWICEEMTPWTGIIDAMVPDEVRNAVHAVLFPKEEKSNEREDQQ